MEQKQCSAPKDAMFRLKRSNVLTRKKQCFVLPKAMFFPPKADGPDDRLPPVGENIFPNRGKIETDFHWHIPKNFRKFAVDRKNNDTYAEL